MNTNQTSENSLLDCGVYQPSLKYGNYPLKSTFSGHAHSTHIANPKILANHPEIHEVSSPNLNPTGI